MAMPLTVVVASTAQLKVTAVRSAFQAALDVGGAAALLGTRADDAEDAEDAPASSAATFTIARESLSVAAEPGALARFVDRVEEQRSGDGGSGEGLRVRGVKAASGINEQPLGNEETIQGALNRLAHAKELAPGADFYAAIENGLLEVPCGGEETRFFDVGWVVLERSSDGWRGMAPSLGVQFDARWVEAAQRSDGGFATTTAGSVIAQDVAGVHKQDPHAWLTGGTLGRPVLLEQAALAALGQLLRERA